jgi:alpha-L-fucosidase
MWMSRQQSVQIVFCLASIAAGAGAAIAMTPEEFRESRLWVSAHFNMATYIPLKDDIWECAKGTESPDMFNPTDLDVDEYLDWVLKIGAKGFLITAMHVDGFCLWPSASSPHNLAASRWYREHGQRNVLREFVEEARERGLKVGYYFSMQDRYFESTHEVNPQTYTAAVRAHLTELLGGDYGQIDLIILDAWPWLAAANYTNLPYDDIYPFIKQLQPNCLVGSNHHEHDGKHGDIDIFEQPAKIDGEPAPGKTVFPCVCCWSTLHQDGRWFGHSDLPPHALTQAAVLAARNKRMADAGYVSIINVAPDMSGKLTEDEKEVLARMAETR